MSTQNLQPLEESLWWFVKKSGDRDSSFPFRVLGNRNAVGGAEKGTQNDRANLSRTDVKNAAFSAPLA